MGEMAPIGGFDAIVRAQKSSGCKHRHLLLGDLLGGGDRRELTLNSSTTRLLMDDLKSPVR
jgi:hypothetical protein